MPWPVYRQGKRLIKVNSRAYIKVSRALLTHEPEHQVIERVQFKREGQISAVAQQRHFEYMKPVRQRDVIHPLGVGIKVPHLPEEGGEQNPKPERYHRPPIAAFGVICKRRIAEPDVDRLEDEVDRDPHEREEEQRPEQHEGQHDPAGDKKDPRGNPVPADDRAAPHVFDKVEAGKEFRTAKHGRDHGRKAQCCPERVRKRLKGFRADVDPVERAQVEQLKQPPDRGRDEKQADIFPRAAGEQGCACPVKNKRIDQQTITQPSWEEAPMRSQACEKPVQRPKNKHKQQPDPSMDRKVEVSRRTFGVDRHKTPFEIKNRRNISPALTLS